MLLKFLKNGSYKIIFTAIYTTRVSLSPYTTTSRTPPTGKNPSLMVSYLIETLGFTEKEAIQTLTKVSSLKSTQKPDSVIGYLTKNGFDKTHVKKMVLNVPKILTFDVDKTLRPKLETFISVGLVGSDLADIVCQSDVLARSLDGHIKPTLDVLRSVFCGGSDGVNTFLVRVLKSSSWMLDHRVRTTLPVSYSLLESYGLSVKQIQLVIIRRARNVVTDPEWVKHVLIRIEEQIGIPRESRMFFHGVCALCALSDETMKSRFKLFRSLGFSDDDILTLVRKNPYTLMNANDTIKRKVNVFINEFGYTPVWIAKRPSALTYSTERRVMPRYLVFKVLKEKGLMDDDCNFFSYMNVTDTKFIQKFVLPYKNHVPDLYDDFMRKVNVPDKAASVD